MGCTSSEIQTIPQFQNVTSIEDQFKISSVNLNDFQRVIERYVAKNYSELSPTSIKRRYQELYMPDDHFETCFKQIYKLPQNWKQIKNEQPLYKSLMNRFHCNLGHPIESLYIFQILLAKCSEKMKV